MQFVALLSGGKDSCYNILQCIEHKHTLVCLANLMPKEEDHIQVEELNSFMYQSAGHTIIPLLAECFDVPLYRRAIRGSAVIQTMNYEQVTNDEVEDLYELLLTITKAHPEVKGVSCGAIVSNYQRIRIEHVCVRLGLTPLTYMWLRDRNTLLDEIVSSGIEAIVVKVAGAGLLPEKHLGKSLDDLLPIFHHLHTKYGLDICGEGK